LASNVQLTIDLFAENQSTSCEMQATTASFVAPFEQGEIGPNLFRAGDMGLKGLVSKRRDRPYQAEFRRRASYLTDSLLFLGFFFDSSLNSILCRCGLFVGSDSTRCRRKSSRFFS
jgi:hypothetical protein